MLSFRRAPWVVAALFFVVYSAMSINRHVAMRSGGYDLGIFEQAVRGYANLRAPVSELKGAGFNLLGDHFHPIIVVIAPLYRLAPTPITLLVVQAFLFAWSTVPVTRLAAELFGRGSGLCIGFGYGLSWGVQRAVAFDFHEVAFAVPLLAYGVEALVRNRWNAAAWWTLPLLLVKEDQWLTAAAIGTYIFFAGNRKVGATLTATAVTAGLMTIIVVIPALSPCGCYPYASAGDSSISNPIVRFLTPIDTKGLLVVALFAPTLFLGLRSPLALLALPSVAARLWSSVPNHWEIIYHYSATLMPITFIAALDALRRLHSKTPRLVQLAPQAILVTAALITVLGNQPIAHPPDLLRPNRFDAARSILKTIPDGADVAASNRLAPQLTNRCRVFRLYFSGSPWPTPEWAAVASASPFSAPPAFEADIPPQLPALGYRVVASAGGVTIYRLQHGPS